MTKKLSLFAYFLVFFLFIGLLIVVKPTFSATASPQDPNASADDTTVQSGNDQINNNNQSGDSVGSGNNQIISSKDAIGLRIVPNPEHFSPLNWYDKNITVKGAPQSTLVDGYEAVRDGRTVYVSAAKIVTVSRCSNNHAVICTHDSDCGNIENEQTSLPQKFINTALASGNCQVSAVPELYTNIYIISYNQDPETATTDIFGQLLQYWKFNIEIKNCSNDVTRACTTNDECSTGSALGDQGVCQATGYCNQTTTKACMLDADCSQGEYCNNKKATIIRDTKRLADLRDVKDLLEYNVTHSIPYPQLTSGTYLTNKTISTWPSWSATFSSAVGTNLPTDPINKLGRCKTDDNDNARFAALTCWDENAKEFAGVTSPYLTMPSDSHVYYYQYILDGNKFSFCTITESGYVQGKNPGSVYCQTGSSCNRNCSGKVCGDDGCAGSCGTCNSGQTCQSGHCINKASTGND